MSQSLRQGQSLDVVLASQRPSETAQPIGRYALEILFNCFCRYPAFFAEARQALKEYHFDPGAEIEYALLFRALETVTDTVGGPSTETLINEVLTSLQQMGGMLPEDLMYAMVRQDGQGLVWSSMNTEVSESTLAYGRQLLQQFLHERTVVFPLRRLLNQGLNGAYPANLPEFLEAIEHQRGAIASLQAVPEVSLGREFGSPILRPSQIFKPVGVPFVDRLLGGQRVGDVNGIIGVIGTGKTTTAVHMATASARQAYIEACQRQSASPELVLPELVIFVTAEESGEKIRPRVESAAFQIPHAKLATMSDWGVLTNRSNLEPYEQQLAVADGGEVLSESERYRQNAPWLRSAFSLLDMSGSQEFPHAGEGFVPELVGNIESLLRTRKQQLRAVYIDWVGILVQRHMDANGIRDDQLRHYIVKFVSQVRRDIAEKFGCTAWLFHQIKTSAITAAPTKLFHHGDAAEASAFAQEMAVCGCMGVPDKDTGCRRLNWSKVRYKPGEEVPPMTVKIHRHFSMIQDVTADYTIDPSGTRFALAVEANMIQGASATSLRVSSGPRGYRPDPGDGVTVEH